MSSPGTSWQPVHVLYGGAHLFRMAMARRAGEVARKALDDHGFPGPLLPAVDAALRDKLTREPVEDFRIDFEDGYGIRTEDEEDAHARAAAAIVAAAVELPRRIGIRIKALAGGTERRARRTLELFLASTRLPADFVVTLPKITSPGEVTSLVRLLEPYAQVGIELMIETPQAMRSVAELIYACEGRCRGIHFGAYDYMAACGITFAGQTLRHPACDFARFQMQMQSADMGVPVSDGVTNLLPVGDSSQVHAAWKAHGDAVRHALLCGVYQGWDIHPAQLVSRYATVFSFFAEQAEPAARRLRNFMEREQQATRIGVQFDDAATVAGLRNFFERAIACGAISREKAREMTCAEF